MVTPSVPELGARVRVDSQGATIRYVGEVAGQSGSWVGLEWDLEARGKHDGSTGGGQLDQLLAANLTSCSVATVGAPGELAVIAPSLSELELASNPLRDWEETLVLNGTGISWQQVQAIECYLPDLAELHLCSNDLEGPDRALSGFQKLTVLSLDHNSMKTWAAVAALGSLPSLVSLSLAANNICSIEPLPPGSTQSAGGTGPFQRLQTLLLADNALSAWSCVDALDTFPALQEVRLTGNAVFSQPNARAEVIARVGALSRLNGSSITRPERKDAELQYLRTLTAHLEAAGLDSAAGKAMAAANPRLKSLQDKFGNVGAAAINQKQGSVMRAGLVTLNLRCESSGSTHTKRLPGSLTIGKLKVLCERLFRIPVQAQVLTLHEEGRQPAAFGEDDGTTISMFDIQGTAEVTVQQQDLQADAAAAALAKKEAKEQHEGRMRQHDKDIELMKRIQEQHYTLSTTE
ncbi:hypothetical protein WJX73_006240 [Symbiochloris irregularis]|uniref:CAP-Gly domain-containing protein n=1 Tax=Symbiochloris irregularis TaxID=706552 RepID=A0AAW1PW32_9CHLO